MSCTVSPSSQKSYGAARVLASWNLARSSFYAARHRRQHPPELQKRGPKVQHGQEGPVTIFAAIDHCTADCVGIHAVKKATRFEALDPIRQGIQEHFGTFSASCAAGLQLRHDHGSVYMSDDFRNEVQFLGIQLSPAFVRQPEGNGCLERFFRTLKEQLLWIRRFRDLAELREALNEFRHRYNEHWIVQRLGYRTPAQARRDFAVELRAAA